MNEEPRDSNVDKLRDEILKGQRKEEAQKIKAFFEGTTEAPQMAKSAFRFGDIARMKSTAETEKLGLAGLCGPVYGQTLPSASGVEVVGMPSNNLAINVYFEGRDEQIWFADDLLELVAEPLE